MDNANADIKHLNEIFFSGTDGTTRICEIWRQNEATKQWVKIPGTIFFFARPTDNKPPLKRGKVGSIFLMRET